MRKYIFYSFITTAGTLLYVSGVSWLLYNARYLFPSDSSTFLIPLFMLLLFVISATITGLLVLGRPVILYLDGKKREALKTLIATIIWLLIFVLVVALLLIS